MKKKVLIMLSVMALLLAGCGGKGEKQPVQSAWTEESSQEQTQEQVQEPESSTEPESEPEVPSGEPGSPEEEDRESKISEESDGQEGAKEPEQKEPEQKESGQEKIKPEADKKPSGEKNKPEKQPESKPDTKPEKKPEKQPETKPEPEQPPHTACSWDGGKVTKQPTCQAEGVKTYTCSVCGKTKTESVPKVGHNYVNEKKDATCTENGYTRSVCSMCGAVQNETVTAATGHTMVETWWPAPPDCTYGGGAHYNKCTKCGYHEDLPPGEPLGHVPDAGTVIFNSTCMDEGLMAHKCTVCGCNLPDTPIPVNPNNHVWAFDEEEQVWYCSRCNKLK